MMARILRTFIASEVALIAGACGSGVDAPDSDRERSTPIAELVAEVSIGEDWSAAQEYQFSGILDVVIGSDNSIWVIDGREATPFVRRYDTTGVWMGQAGREGDGPGEYRRPFGGAVLSDDRLAIRDYDVANRLTIFDVEGALDTTVVLPGQYRWPLGGRDPIQVDTGGLLWLPFSARPGPDRPPPRYLRVTALGDVLDTVPIPNPPEITRDEIRFTSDEGVTYGFPVPYQPSWIWAWHPTGGFAVARTDRYEILQQPAGGTEAASGRAPGAVIAERQIPVVPVTDAEQEAAHASLQERVAALGGLGVTVPRVPSTKPLLRSLWVSNNGYLVVWVSMPSVLSDGEWTEPSAVDVFSPEGMFLRRILVPEAFSIHGLNDQHLWGVARDSLEVESIRRYRIRWPDE